MSYKHKYEKYKNKYLKFKQFGGYNKEKLGRLLELNLPLVEQHITNTVLDETKLPFEEFNKISTVKELGKGNFGRVYKVNINEDIIKGNETIIPKGTPAVAKFIIVSEEKKKTIERILTAEIRAHTVISLSDCNLPKLYGYFKDIPYPFTEKGETQKMCYVIIVELVDGIDLIKELNTTNYDANNTDHLTQITMWINQLENAVECLHKNNIVHRDIKPDNIIKDKNGAKLVDYGLSCRYLTFCFDSLYFPFTSPLKFRAQKANKCHYDMEIEMKNDKYAIGMTILDILSKLSPFKESIIKETQKLLSAEQLKENKLTVFSTTLRIKPETESSEILNEINKFIEKVSINDMVKNLTNKALNYIKIGLIEPKQIPTPEPKPKPEGEAKEYYGIGLYESANENSDEPINEDLYSKVPQPSKTKYSYVQN